MPTLGSGHLQACSFQHSHYQYLANTYMAHLKLAESASHPKITFRQNPQAVICQYREPSMSFKNSSKKACKADYKAQVQGRSSNQPMNLDTKPTQQPDNYPFLDVNSLFALFSIPIRTVIWSSAPKHSIHRPLHLFALHRPRSVSTESSEGTKSYSTEG